MSFFKYTTVTHTEAWARIERVLALKGRFDDDKVEKTQIILDTGVAFGAQEDPLIIAARINKLREDLGAPTLLKFFTVKALSVHIDPRCILMCEAILPARTMVLIEGGAIFEVKGALVDILPQFANV